MSSAEHGFIWMEGEINPNTERSFISQLSTLNRIVIPPAAPLLVYITGGGGDLDSTLHMVEAMRRSARPVTTIAHGWVASGSFVLTQGGSWRYALRNVRLGFHSAEFVQSHGRMISRDVAITTLDAISMANALQLAVFFDRGRGFYEIADLLGASADIGFARARTLNLLDGRFPQEVFLRHRRIARKLISRRSR